MENNESDWEEVNPGELGEDRPGKEAEEQEAGRQSLTPKVLDLMEKISEYGYLTMHEVHLIFGNKTWAYKVVKRLRSEGFVADHDTLMSPRTAHYLTSKGYRVLARLGRLNVGWRFKPERYSVFIFRHRMACAKVGLLLEKHPLVHEFLAESRLFKQRKREDEKLCDGEFWYRVQGHEAAERVGLEVELTLKSNSRLDETFRQLARRDDLDQVWWICADEDIRRAMRREVQRRYLGSQRHFFGLLGEFLAAKGRAELMEPNGTLLAIDPERPTLLPKAPEPPPRPPTPAAPEPSLATAAQAEVTPEPEPAPAPAAEPAAASWFFAWLGSVALRLLKWIWEWIKDSWSLYRYDRWSWELEFHRWPHVGAASALAVGLAVYRHWPAVLKAIDLPPPSPAWRQRRLRRISVPGYNWTLYPLSLRSAAGKYRFRAELVNVRGWERTICGAAVFDTHDRRLAGLSWKPETIKRGYKIAPDLSFEFHGRRSMDRFFMILSEGWPTCNETGQGETFLIQFE